jgi:carbon-monoxide dehydrogenase iron sulfur subunit
MHREAKTGVVAVDQDRCIGCWMCVVTCPFGAVTADPGTGKALKCDLCAARGAMGLGPACVDACPTGAMVYLTPDELAGMRRSATAMASVGAVEEIEESVALWRNFKGGRAI